MRKIILSMFASIDGFVAGANGEADWIFKAGDAATDDWLVANLWTAGLIAMGSRSYYDMADYWPSSDTPFTAPMNEISKIVFSKSGLVDRPNPEAAADGSWASPLIATGDLSEEIARLKAGAGKDIRVIGGARFARALAAAGLIDEYCLLVAPSALGQGLPLFTDLPKPLDLKLVDSKAFSSGAVALVYQPA